MLAGPLASGILLCIQPSNFALMHTALSCINLANCVLVALSLHVHYMCIHPSVVLI